MNKVIILEGPDGSGKTTLAKVLVSRFQAEYRHEGPPPESVCALAYYTGKLQSALWDSVPSGTVVLDRLFLGEHVYGPVARDRDKLGKLGLRLLDRQCRAGNVLQLLCLPEWKLSQQVYEQKKLTEPDDYLRSVDKHAEVYFRYRGLLTGQQVRYDYAQQSLTTLLPHLFPPETPHSPRSLPRGVTGSPTATLLLVGERSNTGQDLPFNQLGHSGAHLDRALQLAGVPPGAVAFINAYPPGSPKEPLGEAQGQLLLDTTSSLTTSSGRVTRVVALGRRAAAAAQLAGLQNVFCVAQPFAVKRFAHHQLSRYAAELYQHYQETL